MPKIIFAALFILLSLVQLSCQSNDRSSILVIAVDELTIGDVPCHREINERSGFHILCKESVRFTHAFTPSTLSVPALASILTGLYPYQHKVRNNGGPGLEAEFELASEVAIQNNYRTSFFSGGAPVFRRSGLNQGFELYEDNIIPTFSSLYRPFQRNAELFLQWVAEESSKSPFFSFIYIPDLVFTTTETISELGDPRNLSFESQRDELDESLFALFSELKKSNRWDSTTIILTGLNGHTTSTRDREIAPLNLHGENTQVALFIKPAQKKRDEAIHWKIDQNVTLVDVGRTLFDLLGQPLVDKGNVDFPSHSLLGALKSPELTFSENRPILLESGWALWRKAGPLRTAGLAQHVLFINDESPRLYNTLVDRFEVNPLPLLQESILPTTTRLQQLLQKNKMTPFPGLPREWSTKLSISYPTWMNPKQEQHLLNSLHRLSNFQPRSLDLLNWTAQIALNRRDWVVLRELGNKHKISSWLYIADRNLKNKKAKIDDSCFLLLQAKEIDTPQLKACSDPLFLEFIDWVRADVRGLSKEAQRVRFERSFRNYLLDQEIQRVNIAAGMIWDTNRDNIFAPSRTELALNLPEYSRLRAQVYRSVSAHEN